MLQTFHLELQSVFFPADPVFSPFQLKLGVCKLTSELPDLFLLLGNDHVLLLLFRGHRSSVSDEDALVVFRHLFVGLDPSNLFNTVWEGLQKVCLAKVLARVQLSLAKRLLFLPELELLMLLRTWILVKRGD